MKDKTYKNYLIVVLMVIYAFNYVDRQALGLLLQDIKVDLALSDTQLGFLTGIAFFLFYSVMGIPIARWADRGNRVAIIAITTALWSLAVALCGFAANFIHLLLIRVGVAIGEAGCVPPAHSLIAEYFDRAERPRAVANYKLGLPLSLVVGYLVAGWLNEFYGWRATFFVLGAPGLLLALLAWLTLREPRRFRSSTTVTSVRRAATSPAAQPSVKEVFVTLWANVTFRQLLLGYSVLSFFNSGIGQWKPAFFMRSFGLDSGELGTWFAAIYGTAGILGIYAGGQLATRFAARNERLQLKVNSISYICFGFISVGIYLSPNPYMAIVLTGVAALGTYAGVGPLFATIQSVVPDRMRAMSIAILFLFTNLVGTGLGPLIAGVLSDALRPWAGEESLRYALMALSPGYVWGAVHYWLATKTVARDLEAAQRMDQEAAEQDSADGATEGFVERVPSIASGSQGNARGHSRNTTVSGSGRAVPSAAATGRGTDQ
jgi:MFS family permease